MRQKLLHMVKTYCSSWILSAFSTVNSKRDESDTHLCMPPTLQNPTDCGRTHVSLQTLQNRDKLMLKEKYIQGDVAKNTNGEKW